MTPDNTPANETIFQDIYDPFVIPRKKMVSWWMRVFCYLFLVLAVLAPVCLLLPTLSFHIGDHLSVGGTRVALYGLRAINDMNFLALFIIGLFMFKGVVGYALLSERDWAMKLGMIDGAIGIILCFLTMLVLPFFDYGFHFSWELLFLFPYQARLWKFRVFWEENAWEIQEKLGLNDEQH
jgi:hypothetical protein